MKTLHASLVLTLLTVASATAKAENLFQNPDFESIAGREILLDQGVLPAQWEQHDLSIDTYSVEGDYGLIPGDNGFGRWNTLTTPASGDRFLAGGLDAESFAQPLTLTPGGSYRIDASIAVDGGSGSWTGTETWSIQLYDTDFALSNFTLATFPPVAAVDQWFSRTVQFKAPANSGSYEWIGFLANSGRSAYMGIDAVSLTSVPEPSHTASLAVLLASLVGLSAMRRART